MSVNRNRFAARFINGQWSVFDKVAYRVVATRALQVQAVKEADKRNASPTPVRR